MKIPLIMNRSQVKFTPAESKIVSVLADGEMHLLNDVLKKADVKSKDVFKFYLSSIRKKIRPFREEIICQVYYHKFYYRYVCLMSEQQTLKIREAIESQQKKKKSANSRTK